MVVLEKCGHQCTSDCRRVGCNCRYGQYHQQDVDCVRCGSLTNKPVFNEDDGAFCQDCADKLGAVFDLQEEDNLNQD